MTWRGLELVNDWDPAIDGGNAVLVDRVSGANLAISGTAWSWDRAAGWLRLNGAETVTASISAGRPAETMIGVFNILNTGAQGLMGYVLPGWTSAARYINCNPNTGSRTVSLSQPSVTTLHPTAVGVGMTLSVAYVMDYLSDTMRLFLNGRARGHAIGARNYYDGMDGNTGFGGGGNVTMYIGRSVFSAGSFLNSNAGRVMRFSGAADEDTIRRLHRKLKHDGYAALPGA